jgi:hypothetical protein
MALSASFNNISIIMWRSDLLLGETGVPGKHHGTASSFRQNLSYNVASSKPHDEQDTNSQPQC